MKSEKSTSHRCFSSLLSPCACEDMRQQTAVTTPWRRTGQLWTGRPQALRRTQSQTFAVSSCTARIALDSNHAGKHALAACDAPLHHAAPAAARGLRPRKACKTPGGARNREPSGLCGGGRTNNPVRLDVRAHLLAEGDASLVIAAHLPLTQPLRPPPSSSGMELFSSIFLPQLAQPDAGTIKIVVTSPCRRFRQWFLRSVRLATDVHSGNPRARSLQRCPTMSVGRRQSLGASRARSAGRWSQEA